MVFVELPAPGGKVGPAARLAVVESVKAASDVYAPLSGEVIAANAELSDNPETVNDAPEGVRLAGEAQARRSRRSSTS